MKYHICPRKLAKVHKYDYAAVRKTLESFIDNGYGQQTNIKTIMAIKHKALQACAEGLANKDIRQQPKPPESKDLQVDVYTMTMCIVLYIFIFLTLGPKGSQL
jgi:hypothetical protein